MFERIAHLVTARRRVVLAIAGLAFVLSGMAGGGIASRLSSGGFDSHGAQSVRAQAILTTRFGTGTPNVILVVTAKQGTIDDPDVTAAGKALQARLAAESSKGLAVSEVTSYWDLQAGNPLGSTKRNRALVMARFPDDDAKLVDFAETLPAKYETQDPASPVTVQLAGLGPLFAEVNDTTENDLLKAEMIAVPITLLLLLLVFRGLVAAMLPLVIGALSVVGTFFVLRVVNSFTTVSIYALNLTTGMGLGLAIDYSLFIVSRFREELAAGRTVPAAVRRTVATAGRTVAFSAMTVAASLLALLVFDLAFLRSFAYAGVAVALLAGAYALVVLPAILAVLGHRVDALSIGRRRELERDSLDGFWHRMALFVMRRPIPIIAAVLVLLGLLGGPVVQLQLGLPDDRVLPKGSPTRDATDLIRSDFTSAEAGSVAVVVTGLRAPAQRATSVASYASALARLDGVERVDAETGIYCGSSGTLSGVSCKPGSLVVPPMLASKVTGRLSLPDATYLSVVPNIEPVSAAGERLVRAIRGAPSPFPDQAVLVGGPSARLVDTKASLLGSVPLALAIIAVITFVLLFMMFGSLLVPAKALVMNVLSLSATFGAMVFIFQEGHGSGLLGFTATGSLSAVIPVLMFCVAFGLSMDYEVFLLSRIKEEHDHGADNMHSVARGLERTGRIVTAAALLMSVVFLAFSTSRVSILKLFGVGLMVAVLLDAFIIRGTLVPAFMRLAGHANWWAPAPLRRFYARFGIHEHVELEADDGVAAHGAIP